MDVVLKEAPNLNCAGILIAGDFNARNPSKSNQQGAKFLDFIDRNKLKVWSDFVGNSFQCSEGGSRIDLVISDLCLLF